MVAVEVELLTILVAPLQDLVVDQVLEQVVAVGLEQEIQQLDMAQAVEVRHQEILQQVVMDHLV
jgi:hypothetical protein